MWEPEGALGGPFSGTPKGVPEAPEDRIPGILDEVAERAKLLSQVCPHYAFDTWNIFLWNIFLWNIFFWKTFKN